MRIPRENGQILILKNSQKDSCPPLCTVYVCKKEWTNIHNFSTS